ncbi:DUF1501 domain-containing protein [Hymenobacter sp. BT664]|uniref:DUF1501 domain-containing protein n=1 Tax=Hymenobacter montanus TaxID=2771359 RepID=A0A927B999_9BACT|nr:DUF1501 domain-containing protein [Hymenobacter montanus]MBD2766476.1 DUF1501 domain-containing protein [Hymenobacter montanus]
MTTNRRTFIKSAALASGSLLIPNFLHGLGRLGPSEGIPGKTLVIVQLSGGNDGLNCVVPFRNDQYYKLRPNLAIPQKDLIGITGEVGLNKNLKELATLYDQGELAILNNVGYPNPNRSHFRSMDIWQSGSDADQVLSSGWVGRYLDASCGSRCPAPHAAVELDDTLSLALKGVKGRGLAFHDPADLYRLSTNPVLRKLSPAPPEPGKNPSLEFLHKTLAETNQSVDYIYAHSKIYRSSQTYPAHEFGRRMKLIAELIGSGSETKVYYISLPGFDTHALQKMFHSAVLKTYAQTIGAFCADLKASNRFNDTVVLTFSEFGRRVAQNASKGTDHGTANNVYIAGGGLGRAGILNEMPNLTQLDEGDLIHTVDFRRVYATLLERALRVNSEKVLAQRFAPLDFLKG